MSKIFTIHVNNKYEFQFDATDVKNSSSVELSQAKYHVLHEDISVSAEIIEADFIKKSYKVKVNNNAYNIQINNDLDNLIQDMGFELGLSKQVNEIHAPMPGLLLDVQVKVGQHVNEDDALLILEAMKMENVITSPRKGTIKSINAQKGDAVDKNQLLVEFEAE